MGEKETIWVVHCEWCKNTIIGEQEKITTDLGSFCSEECLLNYQDCYC